MIVEFYLDVYPHHFAHKQFSPLPTQYPTWPRPEGCVRYKIQVDVPDPFCNQAINAVPQLVEERMPPKAA